MIIDVENRGTCRRGFSLTLSPPRLFTAAAKRLRPGEIVPVFEPYEENLPLESGFYSYVLDGLGRFHVRRGNTSSHSSMVGGADIGAAGRFRINRAGNVAEVLCRSFDYRISIRDETHPTVTFVLGAFANHHALEVSPWAYFQFARSVTDSFYVDVHGRRVADLDERRKQLDGEGLYGEIAARPRPDRVHGHDAYRPEPPPRLYGMHKDQLILAVEEEEGDRTFEVGPGQPRYGPGNIVSHSGKRAFILDHEGWLVVGGGHHLLSGGRDVGAAGQIVFDELGRVAELNLNFSGHYRPPLDEGYARYVYRALVAHPLLEFAEGCLVSGRKFRDDGELSTVLRFDPDDLTSDTVDLDLLIEAASF
jgi:hypothetical protein